MAEVEAAQLPEGVKTEEAEARTLRGWISGVVRLVAIAFALFHIWTAAPFVGAYPDLIQRSIHLSFAFVLCFLLYPARPLPALFCLVGRQKLPYPRLHAGTCNPTGAISGAYLP